MKESGLCSVGLYATITILVIVGFVVSYKIRKWECSSFVLHFHDCVGSFGSFEIPYAS
jgi:hypothetical protein